MPPLLLWRPTTDAVSAEVTKSVVLAVTMDLGPRLAEKVPRPLRRSFRRFYVFRWLYVSRWLVLPQVTAACLSACLAGGFRWP